jgi:transglutaminase-like putative cysteine protease
MQLRVTHETRYDYAAMVQSAQHVAYMTPRLTPNQSVRSHHLSVSPQPDVHRTLHDVFGNTRSYVTLQTPHRELVVRADSVVHTLPRQDYDPQLHATPWEAARTPTEFSFASPAVPCHVDFWAYAQPCFTPGAPLLDALIELTDRVHRDFTYAAYTTEINTPVREVLARRAGVCQDFAHLMIACLRSGGLAVRYVSGYVLTEALPGEARLIGSDASHAWVSAFVPGLGAAQRGSPGLGNSAGAWFDFCPTNNRWGVGAPGEDFVTLAWGRDFGDVSPLRGIITGGGLHTLDVAVTVQSMVATREGDGETVGEPG